MANRFLSLIIPALLVPCLVAAQTAPCGPLTKNFKNKSLPLEVQEFFSIRWECIHFKGELGSEDPEREKFLVDQLHRSCSGQDSKLSALKQKYSKDGVAMPLLTLLNPKIDEVDISEIDLVEEKWCK